MVGAGAPPPKKTLKTIPTWQSENTGWGPYGPIWALMGQFRMFRVQKWYFDQISRERVDAVQLIDVEMKKGVKIDD